VVEDAKIGDEEGKGGVPMLALRWGAARSAKLEPKLGRSSAPAPSTRLDVVACEAWHCFAVSETCL
jgi:hypothetical protein